jgi:hypothetical protein
MVGSHTMPLPIETARFGALAKLASERFGGITGAENEVLRNSASTEDLNAPESRDRSAVRGTLLRWLVTDKEAVAQIDPLGLRVSDATIVLGLNLDFCSIPFRLRFDHCTFQNDFSLKWAEVPAFYLLGCAAGQRIAADGLRTHGNIFLQNLESNGPVRFSDAKIGGDLDCSGAQLRAKEGGLTADGATIDGNVILQRGFHSSGELRFFGTQIGGSLDCSGATLTSEGESLTADGARIGGGVFFRKGFYSHGTIRLPDAQIGGDLDCSFATFSSNGIALAADKAKIDRSVYLRKAVSSSSAVRFLGAQIGGDVDCSGAKIGILDCQGAQVKGNLIWVGIERPDLASVKLSRSTLGWLHDDRASWPLKGQLHLEGLVYQDLVLHQQPTAEMITRNKFAQSLELAAEDRIDWLKLQPESEIIQPQPWMQLAKLLEANGDRDGAKRVIYKFRRQKAQASNPLIRTSSFVYDWLDEQPLRIVLPIVVFWLLGFLVFWRARRMRAMAPTDKQAYDEFKKSAKVPDHYIPFNPLLYALENVLPVAKLGQDRAWAPDPHAPQRNWLPTRPRWLRRFAGRWALTRWTSRLNHRRLAILRWMLILLGWAAAIILAAAISERFKP